MMKYVFFKVKNTRAKVSQLNVNNKVGFFVIKTESVNFKHLNFIKTVRYSRVVFNLRFEKEV